jgi:cell division protein FtsB
MLIVTSYNSDTEDFEEVESPFKTTNNLRHKKLRSPIGTVLTEPPLVIEDRSLEADIEYLPAETKPRAPRKKAQPKMSLGKKLSWAFMGFLAVRFVFMDRGFMDYQGLNNRIMSQKNELRLIRTENTELAKEIQLIQFDKSYQRQMAKEALGVIAADEFLILFGSETPQTSTEAGRQL